MTRNFSPESIEFLRRLRGQIRNLQTFKTELKTSEKLIPQIPPSCLRVSESGLENREHVLRVKKAGADAVLIGTRFMKATDKKQLFQDLFS